MAVREGDSASSRQQAQERELAALAAGIEELRTAFERYFMGLDRLPPHKQREQLERALRNSGLVRAKKTALRFQFQNLQQRMTSYCGYWDRVLRMIEEGTFRRERGQAPPAPPASAAGSKAPAAEPAPSGKGMDTLFQEWTQARREAGVDPHGSVTYDQFLARMQVMRDRHVQQFGCADVEYGVRVKEGKVSLVARPIGKR